MDMPSDMHSKVHSLNRNDSINLLLNSIKAMNQNLAKLIDAEIEKLRYIVNEMEHNRLTATDVIAICQYINGIARSSMNLRTLLQLKFDDILTAALSTNSSAAAKNKDIKVKRRTLDKVPSVINEKRKHAYVTEV